MSTLLASFVAENGIKLGPIESSECTVNNNRYPRHVLKSKNTFKPKCSKALKRKLKKYRLRRDGKEDQDILDVSQTLLLSLKIKSPNSKDSLRNSTNCGENLEPRPTNYLFKMARRKHTVKSEESATAVKIPKAPELASDISPTTESQEKKQKNAFKLLMDSRNKSIGSNSPGKEKTIDESEMQEFKEKKIHKTKRNLALQKMAEAKGALKNKEIEELKDKIIQKKMEKRAERLKTMIEKKKMKLEKNDSAKIKTIVAEDKKTDKVNNKTKTLQLVSIFSEPEIPKKESPEKKTIPKEDEEFLNKLSPSIRKKENMLCYFKKIDKNVSPTDNNNSDSTEIIKVKVTTKVKKRMKMKKLSLQKEPSHDVLKEHNEKKLLNSDTVEQTENVNPEEKACSSNIMERRKRKRKENVMNIVDESTETNDAVVEPIETKQGRPKRNAKRPVKYIDDVLLSSSDDELNIFTPKKRKHIELHKTKHTVKEESSDDIIDIEKECRNQKKKSDKNNKTDKKPTKLAPIFAVKPQLNPAELEAKQKFLYSGVPDQLKKIITQQKHASTEPSCHFQTVVHVQQNESIPIKERSPVQSFYDLAENNTDDENDEDNDSFFRNLLCLTEEKSLTLVNKNSINVVLKDIKQLYPKFPVYRTYKLLKSKRKGEYVDCKCPELDNSIEIINDMIDIVNENPCNLKWTDKYKPLSTNHMLGNFQSIKELKKWLISWKENKMRPKNAATDSDSSDFYDSDTDSRDSTKTVNNLLILNGPVGSGKTCSIYAVAAELAIKVIEVNVSSKRTGKVMLQELHEATQSHKVNRGNGSTENSQKSQEINPAPNLFKKRGRPKKTSVTSLSQPGSKEKKETLSQTASQENVRTVMSLILIDDADIVFDQDDGFSSAIAQLVHCSKRPVILVTSSLECPHLQRFLQLGKVMNMHPFLPRILGTWLDIMCLADNGSCWPGLGSKTLDFFKGDIRKAINCLQFYVTTHKQDSALDEEMSQNSEYKSNIDDENSGMSWADQEASQERNAGSKLSVNAEDAWKSFMGNQSSLLHIKYPHDLFNIWWSVPSLLQNSSKEPVTALLSENCKRRQEMLQLEAVANAIDAISISDYISQIKPDTRSNISSSPWYASESDSVSENQCFDHHNRCHEISNEIMHELVRSSLAGAQRCLETQMTNEIIFPGIAAQR